MVQLIDNCLAAATDILIRIYRDISVAYVATIHRIPVPQNVQYLATRSPKTSSQQHQPETNSYIPTPDTFDVYILMSPSQHSWIWLYLYFTF